MKKLIITLLGIAGFSLLTALPASAQNTGGVFPPTVKEGHKSLQYRIAIDPDNSTGQTGFAQRLHYQQALNTEFMWRIVGQTRKTPQSDFDFDFLQAELFWDLSQDDANYRTGLRLDARLRDGTRSEQFGVNWMNQLNLGQGWNARAVVLSAVQSGNNAANGVNLQTRWQLTKALENGPKLGVELYNNYGYTGNFGSFKQQGHTIGPIISAPLTKDISIFTGALFGLSEAAPDTELRLWVTKNFKHP